MAGLAIDSIVIQSWLRAGEKGGPKSQLCQEKIDWEQRCFFGEFIGMAAPTKRPHLSFSVEAILSLSKRTRREKSDGGKEKSDGGKEKSYEEKEETGNSCEEREKSVPDSTSQAIDSAIDGSPEEVHSEEKEVEENSPDSTSPEKDSKEEEIGPKPGVIRVEDVQVDQS